jgi:hypothetical protein
VTDELALPHEPHSIVCDLLALRASQTPVVIELQTQRLMKRLRQQVQEFAVLVDKHLELFSELYSAILGIDVSLVGPCERWIVWPRIDTGRPDRNAAKLEADGIHVVSYSKAGGTYEFR